MARYAALAGTPRRPRVELTLPTGPAGEDLAARLRAIPGLEADADTGRCVASAPTIGLIDQLYEAGVVLDAFDFPETLASLARPLVVDRGQGRIEVYPRLADRRSVEFDLGDDATFDPSEGCFRAPRSAVADWPDRLLPETLCGQDASAPTGEGDARQAELDVPRTPRIQNPTTPGQAAQNLAEAADAEGFDREIGLLTARVGDVPDWFGMSLYPYQRIGALCVAAGGRRLLADAPGLGKSVQAILAGTLLGATRWIIACPPVVQSNWAHELDRCHVPDHLDGSVAVIRPGRKVPDLPDAGIVIVTDSLLAAPTRRDLVNDLKAWSAGLLIYDEGHRARTWDTARSATMRDLAESARERIMLTGTPVMSNPSDLAPLLAITGQLEPVFGSRTRFMSRYTRSYTITVAGRQIDKIVPDRKHLSELSGLLSEQVWVRRGKDQVLKDLPEKAPPRTMIVDVPKAEYNAATRDVQAKIKTYLRERTRELGQAPSERGVRAWCAEQMGCVSLLRRAAGLAKIPAAADYISDWVEATSRDVDGETVYDRPLIVWGTHQVVMETLDAHLEEAGVPHAVINGTTPMARRDRIVADYQDGQIAVILANIVAAGVGITLTRGSDALFVETEWLPDLVSQAVDRQHRIGQSRTVMATTMVAPGTLDHTIQKVQRSNSDVLDAIVGGTGHQVSVPEDQLDSRAVGEVMWELAEPLLRRCEKAAARKLADVA